ncbi:hypothetical protein APS56_10775 [Pseudalgibacter alginicilyticus]|uniref:Acetyl xylan esterase domain-containing protein n=1 Tax=Pseudalgibacter alginicilyticus TaxID=1736674 RepID=A0A0P0D3L7_9FLAO|nr:acetylxylan esterase [Pseudalgibacter alginicilyticus]ALJ05576.1 hypothetical protein APS56_10775 [Pseudalgibacter alginicilyticus]
MKLYQAFLLSILTVIVVSCKPNEDSKPPDFDDYWIQAVNQLNESPINEEIIKDSIVNDKEWTLYKINSYNNVYIYAWVSKPLSQGKFPIKIRFSGMSKSRTLSDGIPNTWFLKEGNIINMLVDIRGQGLSSKQLNVTNYLTEGLSSKDTYIFKGAYLDAIRTVDFISTNSKSDGNIIVTGGGQGGSLSMVAAALNPKVTMCVIGFPFFSDIDRYDKKQWPMSVFMYYCKKSETDYFELIDRLSYFDMLYFAEKIKVPIFVRANERDNITPIEGVKKFFSLIKSNEKEMYVEPCEGHGCSSNSKKANELEHLFIQANMLSS